jgi:hypothetical protein
LRIAYAIPTPPTRDERNHGRRISKPEIAKKQFDAETPASVDGEAKSEAEKLEDGQPAASERVIVAPKRFQGSVELNPERVGRDASQIADEVVSHLNALVGSQVRVTLEIDADIPAGVRENVVRAVTENSRTLKFKQHGFKKD